MYLSYKKGLGLGKMSNSFVSHFISTGAANFFLLRPLDSVDARVDNAVEVIDLL